MAPDGSGDIYVGGSYFNNYNDTPSNYLVRLNSDGTVDTPFSATTGLDHSAFIVPATDGSGDILLGGANFSHYNGTLANHILRLDSDGQVVAGFAMGSGFDANVAAILPVSDGSGDIYVGGSFTSYNGSACNYMVRLNNDGTLDSAFPLGSGFDGGVSVITQVPDGSGDIYVAGGFTSYNGTAALGMIRLNSDGTVDSSFSVQGTGFSGYGGSVTILTPVTDGSGDIYVGGSFTAYNGNASKYLVRLNSDGSFDSGFATGQSFSNNVFAIIEAPDASGDIYASGNFGAYDGITAEGIVRLNSDGTVDNSFAPYSQYGGGVWAMAPTADGSGDIYMSGWANSGTTRLNSDGTVDSTFDTGTGFNSWVTAITPAIDGSGRIYCSGYFTSYQDTTVMMIIALGSDGSIQ